MRNEQVSCDVCHEPMTAGLLAVTDPQSADLLVAFVPMEEEDNVLHDGLKAEHICRESCAHIRLSRALSPAATVTKEAI